MFPVPSWRPLSTQCPCHLWLSFYIFLFLSWEENPPLFRFLWSVCPSFSEDGLFFVLIFDFHLKNEKASLGRQMSHGTLTSCSTDSFLSLPLSLTLYKIRLSTILFFATKNRIGVKGYQLHVEWKSRNRWVNSYAVNFSLLQMRRLRPTRTGLLSLQWG